MRIATNQKELAELVEQSISDHLCLNESRVIGVTISPDELKESNIIANMSRGYFKYVVFRGIKLSCADCFNAEFINVEFENCEFDQDLSLIKCNFKQTKFKGCTIKFIDFRMCDFTESYFDHCTFTADLYHSANFTDSVIRVFDKDGNNPLPIFFNNCYFGSPVSVSNCQVYTNMPEFRITSSTKDLKKILWTNVTCDRYFAGSDICKFITVGPIGSRSGYTTYMPGIDWVQCGCWKVNEYSQEYGGSLEAFENRVNSVYPEGQYHDEYMSAIQLFKTIRAKYFKS